MFFFLFPLLSLSDIKPFREKQPKMGSQTSLFGDENAVIIILILISMIVLIVSLFICGYAWYISHYAPQHDIQERLLAQTSPRFMRADQFLPQTYPQFPQFPYPPQFYAQVQYGVPPGMPQGQPGWNFAPAQTPTPTEEPQPDDTQEENKEPPQV